MKAWSAALCVSAAWSPWWDGFTDRSGFGHISNIKPIKIPPPCECYPTHWGEDVFAVAGPVHEDQRRPHANAQEHIEHSHAALEGARQVGFAISSPGVHVKAAVVELVGLHFRPDGRVVTLLDHAAARRRREAAADFLLLAFLVTFCFFV